MFSVLALYSISLTDTKMFYAREQETGGLKYQQSSAQGSKRDCKLQEEWLRQLFLTLQPASGSA